MRLTKNFFINREVFSNRVCLYLHLKYEQTNFFVVFVLFNIKFNGTVSLNLIIIAVHAKASKQYGWTSMQIF